MRVHTRELLLTGIALALACLVLAGCGGGEPGLKKEYRMQVTVGGTTYWGMGATKFAELVREKTGGRVQVKPYFGGQLLRGAQTNAAQMVANGAIDCAFESTINTAPVIPDMNVFSLPFFINSYENLDRIEAGETGQRIWAAMRAKGLEPLAWGENGFRQVTNSKRPIRTPDDLKGLRVRVVGSPLFIDIYRQLGADPITMNWGDAVTAFQQGTVDGQENPVGILIPVQIHQYHSYVTLWNYLVDPLVLYWNRKQWEAFPEDIRAAVREAAVTAAALERNLCRAGMHGPDLSAGLATAFPQGAVVADPVAYLRDKGMQVDTLDEAGREAFRNACRPVMETWTEKLGPDLIEAARRDMAR